MQFDVGILGGGIVGWACADALIRTKPNLRISVFEREQTFGMGATNLAAGGVRAQFGSEINIRLSKFSIDAFERMPQIISFRQHGYLFVAATQASADYLEKINGIQRKCAVDANILSREEVMVIAPYLNTEDILCGSFAARDGYLDPYAVCYHYEKSARKCGVVAQYGYTSELPKCNITIIATGQWSREVGQEFGLEIPITSEKHQLALAGPADNLPIDLPMVVDLDSSFHFRREGDGILIGFNDADSEGSAFDYSFLEKLATPGMHRLPILAELGFDTKKCWAGFYAETPDHHAVIDRIGDVVVCTGFGGHGVMHSPAAGQAVAELVLQDKCETFDLHPLRLSRFEEGDLTHEPMVI